MNMSCEVIKQFHQVEVRTPLVCVGRWASAGGFMPSSAMRKAKLSWKNSPFARGKNYLRPWRALQFTPELILS